VFVTPVDRVHYDTPVAIAPVVPGETPTSLPTPMVSSDAVVSQTTTSEVPPTIPAATATPYPAWDGTQPINILLLGVDTRIGESQPPRSDTMIVVRVDPVAKRVDMVSIPRDLLVEIPGFSSEKVNAAYPLGELATNIPGGGPTLAAQTIEYNFGIRIDYFAEVDIAGMEEVVDILGGIIIDVPGILKDDQFPTADYGYTRVYFSPGIQRMYGREAVQYSRTRHDDGDFARQDRQHQVLRAIRFQAESTGIITRLPEIISEVGDSVRTDLSISQVLSLARLGQDINEENVYSHSLLPYISELWSNEGYYLIGNWTAIRALFADFPDEPDTTNDLMPSATPEAPFDP
jgi:polyisoprenyl-teichoic acid--peptidoglycan teichoic acid transferase